MMHFANSIAYHDVTDSTNFPVDESSIAVQHSEQVWRADDEKSSVVSTRTHCGITKHARPVRGNGIKNCIPSAGPI
jgi:hypothetical protein